MTKRTTIDVTHTGDGGPIRVPADESERGGLRVSEYAAGALARRMYGPTGHMRTCRLDSWTEDGTGATYQAFIGRPGHGSDRNSTVGRNVWLYVTE